MTNNLNGFFVIDKPSNYTSRDVVNIVSKYFHTKKVGHTGTLDPLATGILIITLGKYTKLSELVTNYDKEYIAQLTLGIQTDTYDIEGKIIKEKNASHITKQEIKDCLNHFIGPQIQEVPIYSAVKVNGKKLYNYARNNEEVILPKKNINIKNITLLSDPTQTNNKINFAIKCQVTKGTYIRSLVNDIGNYLSTGAIMTALRRTKQGSFTLTDAYTLDDIIKGKYKILKIKDVIKDIQTIKIDNTNASKIKNGNIIENKYNTNMCLFIDDQNNEIAIYQTTQDKLYLKPYKML